MRTFLAFLIAIVFSGAAFGGEISAPNSTSTPLASGATFTGQPHQCFEYASVISSAYSDQAGSLYIEQSPDGTNWDSVATFEVKAGGNGAHRVTPVKRFCRVRYTNTSANAQTAFRLQTVLSNGLQVTSALNAVSMQDADAIVTKSFPAETLMAEGKLSGYATVNKFGFNPDIDTGSTPEDIWGGSGPYTGWATAAETLEIFSDSADDTSAGTGLRSVRIVGLAGDYTELAETVVLNGTTPVTTTAAFLRAHTAFGVTAGSGGANAGTLTVRQSSTTSNVMLTMLPGKNQTNCSCYTVPAGKTAYMKDIHGSLYGTATAAVEGFLWSRSFGGIFRARRPFTVSNSSRLQDHIFGGLPFTEKSDLILRVSVSSANNVVMSGGYDLVLVDN